MRVVEKAVSELYNYVMLIQARVASFHLLTARAGSSVLHELSK